MKLFDIEIKKVLFSHDQRLRKLEKSGTGGTGGSGETDSGSGGITAPVNGFFTLAVDEDGNLYAYSAEAGTTPDFEYDSETGDLYVTQEI